MIDTHCHLNLPPLCDTLETYLSTAIEAGVSQMVIIGTEIDSSEKACELAEAHEQLYAAIGIHPDVVNTETIAHIGESFPAMEASLTGMVNRTRVVAIGECGLDYVGIQSLPKEQAFPIRQAQKKLFGMQIQLAKKFNLPLVIHARSTNRNGEVASYDVYPDILDTIKHFSMDDGIAPTCILHCMSGTQEYLAQALALGSYISFAGNVTYPSATSLRELLHATPLDRLLIETDSPFLAPKSKRGTTNEPAFVAETLASIATELGMDRQELETITTANAKRVFQLA